jgi:cyclin B
MEGKILLALQFNITQPSMNCFLQRYGRVAGLDKKNLLLAQYLLELALVEIKFITYKPSLMVSAVVYLVHKIR